MMIMQNKNVELGQMMFCTNQIQEYDCPDWIIALLQDISRKLDIVMRNRHQENYFSPFDNTGNKYVGDCFEVYAYEWDEEEEQNYNFKYKDIEISWYKYLGRGTTINNIYEPETIITMYNDIMESLLHSDNEGGMQDDEFCYE